MQGYFCAGTQDAVQEMAERSNAAVLSAGSRGKTVDSKGPGVQLRIITTLVVFFMLFFAYILISSKPGNYYFGYCENLSLRLSQHNSGKVKSTKSRRPWTLHYSEEFHTKSEAFKREQFFKSFEGRKWLYEKEILKRTD